MLLPTLSHPSPESDPDQAFAYRLEQNASYAAAFPFLAVLPCTECAADGTMVPFGNVLYPGGRPQFGQVGFTPRNLRRVDRVVAAALAAFGGDPERISLTSTSYGGRGLYWYAAARPEYLAALVPMAASCSPNHLLAEGICCASGKARCCPPVWHVVGANDPGTVHHHDAWHATFEAQQRSGRRSADYRYVRYAWAPPPRQTAYAHMTGHAPYELAWGDDLPQLQEWLLRQRCVGCRGPPREPLGGPDTSWELSDDSVAAAAEAAAAEAAAAEAAATAAAGGAAGGANAVSSARLVGGGDDARVGRPVRETPPPDAGTAELLRSELQRAIAAGRADEATRLLDNGASPHATAAGGDSPLHAVARAGLAELARTLLQRGASLGARATADKSRTPLHAACHHGHAAMVAVLLAAGAEVDAGEVANWRPLHEVAHTGDLAIGRLLLDAGASVDARADGGWSALHQASGNGHAPFAALLIERGAAVGTLAGAQRLSALHVAVQMRRLEVECLLLQPEPEPEPEPDPDPDPDPDPGARPLTPRTTFRCLTTSTDRSSSSTNPTGAG